MPTPSSVNPELGVVTAANLLSAYAAVPSRDTDAEAFVSSLRTQEDVDALCDKYGVPKEFTARPAGDLRANSTPPPGAICVYASALKAGMRVPLHRFFREVLAHFGIAPAQLTPNGWRAMAGFLALCHSAGVPPLLAVFRRFFVMCSLCQEHEKGWYLFRPRRDSSGLRFRGLPKPDSSSIMRWKHEFFFLSSPEPWPCAVEWSVRSDGSSSNPVLTVEESQSMLKLLSAHGGAAVDLRSLLPATCSRRRSRLCKSNLAAASPPPPPSSIRMDPSVHDMMKTMLAEKAAAQASASASAKKRTWEEANGGEEVPPAHLPSTSRYDRDTTKAARELLHLHGTDAQPLERAFATNEPSDDAAIRQAANYALELEQKLVAREGEAAALREQLEEAKNELAEAKRAADAEREKAGAELETTKAELAAANQAAEAEAVKMKAELAAAVAEALKTKVKLADLAGANQAVETELVKTKAKLAAAEAELKAAATVQELLASEEKVRRRAELALEGYQRWRGRHAPAGSAA